MYERKEKFPLKSWYISYKDPYTCHIACFVPSQVNTVDILALQCTVVVKQGTLV